MNMLTRACAIALALLVPAVAIAQHATYSAAPAGYAPEVVPIEVAATSTAQQGTVTSAAAIATSGTATIAAGVATIGPIAPQLGRSIRVLLKGTWVGSVYVGTSTDACATINPLTIGGQSWASFTANANEDVDTPHIAGVVYCGRATITSGTLTYAVRQ